MAWSREIVRDGPCTIAIPSWKNHAEMTPSLLDSLPIILLVALFVAINVVVYEIGYQIRKWGRRRGGEDAKPDEGPRGSSSAPFWA